MRFLEVLQTLSQEGIDFIIVGGVAARLHGSTRLTQDLDIVPRLEAESWKKLIDVISQLNTQPRIPESLERIADVNNIRKWMVEKNMLAVSFRSPRADVEIDLLISESDRFDELLRRASTVTLDGQIFHVASIDDLIDMKTKAGRDRDLYDIEILKAIKAHREP
jgi:predicted nucleotidyltransferase